MQISHNLLRSAVAAASLTLLALPTQAHHGFGLYQLDIKREWRGTLTKMNLVNPHSYMEIDVANSDGSIQHMRCEMRAATLLKRAGWTTDMFKVGASVHIEGNPHRDDPGACYTENFSLDGAAMVNRNAQFSQNTKPVDTSNRPLRLPDGQLNISGDWAVEQLVLTVPPSGGNGSMVPKSRVEDFRNGRVTLQEIQAAQPPRATVVYTAEGDAAAKAFNNRSPIDNPWFNCKPTSIIRDWTADWPINRFTQSTLPSGEKVIDITYGLYNFERRIHIGMTEHPANIAPNYAGHSIGNWEGDTLVVDTVGFAAGVLSPPTRSSEQLRIVERFTLDTNTFALKREYTVTDPVYLAAPYASYDVMNLSDVPFEAQECRDLTPEFQQ